MNLKKTLHVIYVGFVLSKMHITAYVAAIINTILWFTIIFVPATVFSEDPKMAVSMFLPGVYALTVASAAMWTATEFLRWNVYHGLTDLYRENGLTVFHYLISYSIVDSIFFGVATYFASTYIIASYTGLSFFNALPANPQYLLLAIVVAIPMYLLMGSLIGYLMASTSVSGAWINIIQMIVAFGTIVPPKTIPSGWLILLNPSTYVAEILRIGYNTNTVSSNALVVSIPIAIALFTLLGYWIGFLCDKRIARYGLEYRY